MVRHTRFELVTTRLKVVCSTNWANDANGVTDGDRTRDNQCHKLALYQLNYGHHNIFGAGNEVRTRDIQLGRLTLYQLSYSRTSMVGIARFELAAPCSQGRCATGLRYIPTYIWYFVIIAPFFYSVKQFFSILLLRKLKYWKHYIKWTTPTCRNGSFLGSMCFY